MKKLVVTIAVYLVFSNVSLATCKDGDLSGAWKIYTTLDLSVLKGAISCSLNMPAKNSVIKADSTCSLTYGGNGKIIDGIDLTNSPLSGTLKVDSQCHVTGQFSINLGKMTAGTLAPAGGAVSSSQENVERKIEGKVDAFISKGKDSISGMVYDGTSIYPSNGLSLAPLGLGNALIGVQNRQFNGALTFTGVKL